MIYEKETNDQIYLFYLYLLAFCFENEIENTIKRDLMIKVNISIIYVIDDSIIKFKIHI